MNETSFDQGLKNLEEIVKRLENSECSLEEALKLFEEGVKLARVLNDKLDKAETTIELLLSEADGHRTVPFEGKEQIARDA